MANETAFVVFSAERLRFHVPNPIEGWLMVVWVERMGCWSALRADEITLANVRRI
jgi:hypothetical protein